MHNQPRYRPLDASSFFNDGRSARPLVPGTVARGHLRTDTKLYRGRDGQEFVTEIPLKVTRELMVRGQDRYNIFCTPCHGRIGDGEGMVVQRGFRHPPTFHQERLHNQPVGHFYDVITSGFGAMASYASRIPVEDRWAIVAYIRALQLAHNATITDVPACRSGETRGRAGTGRPAAMTPAMDNLDAVRNKALMVGAAGLAVCLIGAFINPDQFFRSWLVAYLYWAAIPLGCFALLMLHHMVGGAWGIVIRRLLESGTRTIPLLAVLVLPILAQLPRLYLWARPGVMETDHLLHEKAAYLNIPFFLGRTAFYFAIWIFLSWLLNKWSQQQENGDAGAKGKLQQLAGPGLILYGLTVTFAVVDWVMSLEPHWYSTIYGMIFMIGQALATIAFVVIALRLLSDRRPMSDLLKPSHFHDLGNLMLAFVMLWAYTNISQFIIIWSGNLPEETPWYYTRLNGGWGAIAVVLVVLHWAIPFLILLVRKNKQQAKILASLAVFMLFMRLVDLIWVVAPSFHEHGISLHWLDLAAPVAVGGLWVGFFTWQLGRRSLEPLEAAELGGGGHHDEH